MEKGKPIMRKEVDETLRKLNGKKIPGAGGISAELVKNCGVLFEGRLCALLLTSVYYDEQFQWILRKVRFRRELSQLHENSTVQLVYISHFCYLVEVFINGCDNGIF